LLSDLVAARARGETPERMREQFPSLPLAQVYGALVYYLEHQPELDARFMEERRTLDALRTANRAAHAEVFDALRARFEAERQQRGAQDAPPREAPSA
jgi:hypothetical protein